MTEWDVLRDKVAALEDFIINVGIFIHSLDTMPEAMAPLHSQIDKQRFTARSTILDIFEIVDCAQFYDEILQLIDLIDLDIKRQAIDAHTAKKILRGE